MKSYRLVVRQQGRVVGHFDTSGSEALEDACEVSSLFGAVGGYQCDLLVSDSEKRILESSPEGMKVLSREKCYRPHKAMI
ncbi:MAG: cytoplasmic protein [Klebsiella huaxiensis]|uniref:cytoplasmic protein n=1 Tax=Klebsiella huaxiensis TaxID=2153354 RepID=UPI0026EC0A44|nr:cytoplasmic protein [Klebsiella huaxiensis]WEJ86781.1 MAG: cytoplasmic protein [Klebsiella huaxiensis]